MSFDPKPCPHCGGVSFHVLPNVQLEAYKLTSVFGMAAGQKLDGWWRVSIVVCAQCMRTDMFTTNLTEVGHQVPGAYTVTASR